MTLHYIMDNSLSIACNSLAARFEDEPDEEGASVYEHFRFIAEPGVKPIRIDKYLILRLSNTSRNRIQHAAEQGFILVNGKAAKNSYKVKPGDEIVVLLDHPKYDTEIKPENLPLDIVYEDDDVMVVNKAAGMVVHPGISNYTGTLVNALAWHFQASTPYDGDDALLGLVHRIDKDTSGLLVIAKNADAKTSLGKQFLYKTTRRLYNAVVWGSFKDNNGRIEGNIARNPKDRLQMAVFPPDSDIGRPAVTHYHVLEDYGPVSLVECRLETGRTHQIRAHMKHIGHPLFNDARYGGNIILRGIQSGTYKQFVRQCFDICPRQALHAKTLGFKHPRTGKDMDFTSPLPPDMATLVERWRQYAAGNMHI